MNNTVTQNQTTYTSYSFKIKNTKYVVLVVSGRFNYVTVKKIMGISRTMGKDFQNFDEAIANYKNPQIKVELLKIEMGLN